MSNLIVVGDATSHNGTVLTGTPTTTTNGKAIARVGDMVSCPKCKGTFPIVSGAPDLIIDGAPAARHGDFTACGATLISSQQATTWGADKGDTGRSKETSSPTSVVDNWIKFKLDEVGSCEGMSCIAHFNDGSQMQGVFDSDNVASFSNPTGRTVERIEFASDVQTSSASVTEALLNILQG